MFFLRGHVMCRAQGAPLFRPVPQPSLSTTCSVTLAEIADAALSRSGEAIHPRLVSSLGEQSAFERYV